MVFCRRYKGFSLLELLIVLVIISSIAVLVAPKLSGTLDSLNIKTLSRDMASSLRATRQLAISRGQDRIWTLDLAQHAYQDGRGQKWVVFDKDINVFLTTVSKERISDSLANIRFFADGSASGGEVALTYQRLSYVVQVNWLTGRVKVYDGR
jgi:general secretion pathway protein H